MKLRAAHTTLRIVLCSVLGAVVAAGGTAAIYFTCNDAEENLVPINKMNTKTAVPEGVTPSSLAGEEDDSGNTLYYLAYVLDNQEAYSVYAANQSGSMGINSYTHTYKDYSGGIMVATDITSGSGGSLTPSSAVQTCYAENLEGELLAYRRTGSNASTTATPTDISWKDDIVYYDQDTYRSIYGEYSTEMTVYLINEDTVDSWGAITDNGDGTYTQVFNLNSGAGLYYQYAMKTNGGLSDYPSFESIKLTATFDENWQVLGIVAEDVTAVKKASFTFNTSATTTTEFSYGASAINTGNYGYYESYFKEAMLTASAGGTDVTSDIQVTDLLMSAFADVLDGGDQFAFTLELGDNTYYGLIYLQLDMDTISSDTYNAIAAKLLISSDETYDTQDLYIEYAGGDIDVYYSEDFAMTADIQQMIDVVGDFSTWINSYQIGGSTDTSVQPASAKLTADSSSSFSLESLLEGLALKENNDGTVTVSLALEDLFNISANVVMNFSVTETESATTYALIDAVLSDVSYSGTDISLGLTLTPTDIAEITRDKSQTVFDLAQAAESVYALLDSNLLELSAEIDGEKLYTLLTALIGSDYDEYLEIIKQLDIDMTAYADVDGILAKVDLDIKEGETSLIALTVNYEYDGTTTEGSNNYGTAYVSVTEFMGADCSFNVYCDIADLVTSVNSLITVIESYTDTQLALASEEVSSEEESGESAESSSSLDLISIITSVLGMDFGSLIKEVKADGYTIATTIDVDYALEILGISLGDISIGEVYLDYTYSTDDSGNALGGTLSLDVSEFGLSADLTGSADTLAMPSTSGYLDLTGVVETFNKAISGNSIALTASLTNLKTGTSLDNYTVNLTAKVDPSSSSVGVTAYIDILKGTQTMLALSAYYAYDGTSDSYGLVYLNITNLLGTACTVSLKCDIDEVVTNINTLLSSTAELASSGSKGAASSTGNSTIDSILSVVSTIINDSDDSLTEIVSEVMSIVDGLDISSLINGIIDNKDNIFTSLKADGSYMAVTVNTSTLVNILSETLAGLVNFGNLTLSYSTSYTGTDETGITDGGCVGLELGNYFTASVYGSGAAVEEPTGSYLDVNDVINALYNTVLVGDTVAVSLNLSDYISNSVLDGYTVTATAYADTSGISLTTSGASFTGMDVQLQFTIVSDSLKDTVLAFTAYYSYSAAEKDYGTVYLTITNLLGAQCSLKLYCDIKDIITSVEDLIDAIENFGSDGTAAVSEEGNSGSSDSTSTLVKYLTTILSADETTISGIVSDVKAIISAVKDTNVLENILTNLTTGDTLSSIFKTVTIDNTQIYVTVDTDKLVDIIADLSTIDLGDATVSYVNSKYEDTAKNGYVALTFSYDKTTTETGEDGSEVTTTSKVNYLTAAVYGSNVTLTKPNTSNYINLTELVDTITAAVAVAEDIAASGASFTLDGEVTINGVEVVVEGKGEVVLGEETYTTTNTDGTTKTTTQTVVKSVAVDLTLTVGADGSYTIEGGESGTTLNIKVAYVKDYYYSGCENPFLYVIIDGTGLAVTYDEYKAFTAQINSLIDLITDLTSGECEEETDGTTTDDDDDDSALLTVLSYVLEQIGTSEFISTVSSLSDVLNSFTITAGDNALNLTCLYGESNEYTLALAVKAATTEGETTTPAQLTLSLGSNLSAAVWAYNGTTGSTEGVVIGDSASTITTSEYTSTNLSGMVQVVYTYIFNVLDSTNLTKLFGSNAYTLDFTLTGSSSGIEALEGVDISVTLSAAEISGGTNEANKNLYSLDADIEVSGFTIALGMVYYDSYIYVSITDINGTSFSDLAVKVSTTDIYDTLETLVNLILDEEVISLIGNLVSTDCTCSTGGSCNCGSDCTCGDDCTCHTAATCSCAEGCTCGDTEGSCNCGEDCECEVCAANNTTTTTTTTELSSTLNKVFELLYALLDDSFIAVTEDSETSGNYTVIVDVQSILDIFEVTSNGYGVSADVTTDSGSVTAVNATVTSTYTDSESVTHMDAEWLTFALTSGSSAYTSVSSSIGANAGTFYTGSYVDISFVSTLLSDAATFAKTGLQTDENEGTTGVEYTFSGSISIPISINIGLTISETLNITDVELTIGYNSTDGLYFNMFANINKLTVAVIYTPVSQKYVGISYRNGLITLARGLDSNGAEVTGSTIYWVMTLDYFLDNLFEENDEDEGTDSPIRWLLQTGSVLGYDLWNTIVSSANLKGLVSSGLGNTEELYLYGTSSLGASDSVSIFGSEYYLASFIASIISESGSTTYSYGSYSSMYSALGLSSYADYGYYAFSLGTGLLGSTLSPLYIGLTRSSDYGLGGLLAYLAIDEYLEVSVNLAYSGSAPTIATDYYKMAIDGATVDTTKVSTETSNDYEYYKFGSVKIEWSDSKKTTSYYDTHCLVDNYVTVVVWELNDDGEYIRANEYYLRYGSTVYLYSLTDGLEKKEVTLEGGDTYTAAVIYVDESNMTITTTTEGEGENAVTTVTGDLKDGESEDELPEYISVTSDINIYEYVTDSTVYTLTITAVDGSNNKLLDRYEYNVLAGSDLPTDIYSGYTLLNGTWYSDEKMTQEVSVDSETGITSNMTLYGKFVRSTVTINGVTYTFNSTSSDTVTFGSHSSITVSDISGGYYVVTGYTSAIMAYYTSGTWLVLENKIDGYPVLEIAAGALGVSSYSYDSNSKTDNSLKNVLVPENIVMIGSRAFLNNKTIESIVFLADTVYFSNSYSESYGNAYYNSISADSTTSKNFPFYGCTTQTSDTSSGLTVYYTHAYDTVKYTKDTLDGGVFVVNNTESGDNRYTRTKNDTSTTSSSNLQTIPWTYYSEKDISVDSTSITNENYTYTYTYTDDQVKFDVAKLLQTYGYDSNLYDAYGVYFYKSDLTGDTMKTAIAEYVVEQINAYTAKTYYYINAYSVSVAITGTTGSDGNARNPYAITVTVTENKEEETATAYYLTNVTSMLGTATKTEDGGETAYAYADWNAEISSTPVTTGNTDGTDSIEVTYSVSSSGSTTTVTVTYSGYIEYFGYTLTNGGTVAGFYVKQGTELTVTASNGDYVLNNVAYSDADKEDGNVTGSSQNYTISSTASTTGTITLYWTPVVKSENTVTVYSDISFKLTAGDEETVTNINSGTQTVDLGTESTKLDDFTVTAGEKYYYFLGWAAYVDSSSNIVSAGTDGATLKFVSSITHSAANKAVLYAIWGYNANVTLYDYSATSGASTLPTGVTGSSGTFYNWYTYSNGSFDTIVSDNTLQSGEYTYYARMSFTLYISFSGSNTDVTLKYGDTTVATASTNNSTFCFYSSSNSSEIYYITLLEGKTFSVDVSADRETVTIDTDTEDDSNTTYTFTGQKNSGWNKSSRQFCDVYDTSSTNGSKHYALLNSSTSPLYNTNTTKDFTVCKLKISSNNTIIFYV